MGQRSYPTSKLFFDKAYLRYYKGSYFFVKKMHRRVKSTKHRGEPTLCGGEVLCREGESLSYT